MTPMTQATALFDASALLHDSTAIAERIAADGYLFVRQALPTELLWDLRADVAAILVELAWIDEADPLSLKLAQGQALLHETNSETWRLFYDRVQCLRSFHALAHAAELQPVLAAICGTGAFIHPRHICRLCFPQSQAFTTPPHQDYFYIGGARDTWTAWIPIGNCACELGSLAVLPGSHRQGLLPVETAQGAGGHATQAVADAGWARADFQCGDVLFIHSLLIHQGQDNLSDRTLRLSLDVRFQHPNDPVHASSLQPHMHYLSWDDIYQAWPANDTLRYYWQQQDLHVIND